MMERNMKHLSQRGFSLLEVVIAIAIFAIGMLALASLQGSLTRSSADANLRMVAANIAERTLEDLRAFKRIDVDPAGLEQAYDDIQDIASETVTDGGISFTRTINVSDYFFVRGQDKFLSTEELDAAGIDLGVAVSDFKLVEVNVSWGGTSADSAGFQLDESQNTLSGDDLGSGDITVSSLVSSITTQGSGRVSSQGYESPFVAVVDYNRDANREVIALKLGEGKLKESLTPEPDVTRDDQLVETRFDVITYSQDGLFLRREEFAVVACECTFETGDVEGRRPVVWAGDEYVRGHSVQKPRGESANNQQSPLCNACCADHHDGGSDEEDHSTDALVNVYSPFRTSSEYITGGDHAHYNRAANGGLQRVTSGDYVEACRLVRQDGFFRVAQDFRREDLNVFPDDFLDDTGLIDFYSSYVTGAVSDYVTAAGSSDYTVSPTSCIGLSPCAVDPAPKQGVYNNPIETTGGLPIELPSWTTFPQGIGIGVVPDLSLCEALGLSATCQQLTSRGVYLDYLSKDLRSVLATCTGDKTSEDAACKSGDVELDRTGSVNPLELIPFFDVQMTKLNRWNEGPLNDPVDTLNEPLATGNNHNRGVVYKVNDGISTVLAKGHRGNVGFTDTFPIDNQYFSQVTDSSLVVYAGGSTVVSETTAILGNLSHLLNGNVDIIVTGLNGVECGQTTADYGCSVPTTASNPQIKLSGYGKNVARIACSVGSVTAGKYLGVPDPQDTGTLAFAVFDVSSLAQGSDYNFLIVEASDGCPTPPD